jgi:lipopolysaccharide transport system permease protein
MVITNLLTHLRRLLLHHELVAEMVVRTLKARYRQSILGAGLAVLQPLLLMLVFSLAFSRIIRFSNDRVPYFLIVYCGLLPWNLLATGLAAAVPSVSGNAQLMSKIYFPREVFPLAAVLASVVDFLIGLVLLLLFGLIYHLPLSLALLALPVLLVIQIVLMIGITLLLAALNVFYRDVSAMLPLLTMLWMFLTPILYPESAFPERYRFLLLLNPMAALVRAYRSVILDARLPPAGDMAYVTVFALACFLGSYLVFKRLEPVFVEVA